MREIEWKILCELMKNSRVSDRELARKIDSSQPTVSRNRKRLEKKGFIKEYTAIPDFQKLGYEIMLFTFLKLQDILGPEEAEEVRERLQEELENAPEEVILFQRGLGLGYHGVIISVHKSYSDCAKIWDWLKRLRFLNISDVERFMIGLEDPVPRPLTLAPLANALSQSK